MSDLLSEDATKAVGLLAERGHELSVIHVLDSNFMQPNFAEEVELVDVEGGANLELFGGPGLNASFKDTVAEWINEMQTFCSRRNVRYITIDSVWPLEDVLLRRLRVHRLLA